MNVDTSQAASRMRAGRRARRSSLPHLRLRVSERRVLLFVVDVLALNAALALAWTIGTDQTLAETVVALKWFITLTVLWIPVALFFDLYDLARSASTFNIVRNASLAVAVTVLIYTFIPSLTPPLRSRSLIFLFLALAELGIVGWRIFYAQLFVQPWFKHRVLVVGAGWAGRTLAEAMQTAPNDANPYRGTGYQLLGFVDDRADLAGQMIEGIPVLGTHEILVPMAKALQVDEVIVSITHRHAIDDDLFDALLRCRELGLRVSTMSSLYERLLGRVPVQHVGRDLYSALPMGDSPLERLYFAAKRLVDLAGALVGLVLLGMVIPFVALANARSSPGPLFYGQTRVGKGGRHFRCLKFRSMVPDAEKHTGAVWAAVDDHRVTPVGRFLRKSRLDELPQVVNVLKGDMSLIGPRPERPEFVEELAHEIPFYRARHAVRPGITGWAQVQYRYGNSSDDARIKLEYDLYYVKHFGTLLDLRILLRTVSVVVRFQGT